MVGTLAFIVVGTSCLFLVGTPCIMRVTPLNDHDIFYKFLRYDLQIQIIRTVKSLLLSIYDGYQGLQESLAEHL